MFEKIVVVTRKTRLEELIERFNTRAQAKFYIEHSGGNFSDYEREDSTYKRSADLLMRKIKSDLKLQLIDRGFLPTFLFTEHDLVVVLGQDGLVANAAKYVGGQPIMGVNPDPERYDGILVPLQLKGLEAHLQAVIEGQAQIENVTLAEAVLNDGQKILAFNDLFIGASTHVSARYSLTYRNRSEAQSSSGVIVSTGAGSTGWLSSVFNMASSVARFMGGEPTASMRLPWDTSSLMFVVREPFVSKHSSAAVTTGLIEAGDELVIESRMPQNGTIFSDGIEYDYLEFNSGAIARIRAAQTQAHLVSATGKAREEIHPALHKGAQHILAALPFQRPA